MKNSEPKRLRKRQFTQTSKNSGKATIEFFNSKSVEFYRRRIDFLFFHVVKCYRRITIQFWLLGLFDVFLWINLYKFEKNWKIRRLDLRAYFFMTKVLAMSSYFWKISWVSYKKINIDHLFIPSPETFWITY